MKPSTYACLLALCLSGSLAAQDISGAIEGVVADASGGGVPNAKVTIQYGPQPGGPHGHNGCDRHLLRAAHPDRQL